MTCQEIAASACHVVYSKPNINEINHYHFFVDFCLVWQIAIPEKGCDAAHFTFRDTYGPHHTETTWDLITSLDTWNDAQHWQQNFTKDLIVADLIPFELVCLILTTYVFLETFQWIQSYKRHDIKLLLCIWIDAV